MNFWWFSCMRKVFVDWLMLICTFNIMLHFISRNKSSRRLCFFFLGACCRACCVNVLLPYLLVTFMLLICDYFSVLTFEERWIEEKKKRSACGKNLLEAMSTNHPLQGCYQIVMWQKQACLTCKTFLQNPLGIFMLPWLHVAWWKSILTTSD